MPTKGPHTAVWVMMARGHFLPQVAEAVTKAPAYVMEKMLEQMGNEEMKWSSDTPVYAQLKHEHYLNSLRRWLLERVALDETPE